MKRVLLSTIALLALANTAKAELTVGVLAGIKKDSYSYTAAAVDSVEYPMSSRVGALLTLPLFPLLSLRTGVMLDTDKFDVTYTGLSKVSSVASFTSIPLDLQIGLPLTGLYVYGGAVLAMNTKYEVGGSAATEKLKADTRMNLGLGYEVFSLAVAKLALEVNYEKGMSNISQIAGEEIKSGHLGLNLAAKIGF